MSVDDYFGANTRYATGATAHGKRALAPAPYLQFPYLPRDQYELGLETGLLDATYPLDYTDYLRTVEDVFRDRACTVVVEEIAAVDPARNDVMIVDGAP